MHDSVMEFVSGRVRRYGLRNRSVLEVGALDVNGSVRGMFTGDYLATDMRAGRGVDRVVDAHDLAGVFPDAAFEVVVCVEMLEHDDLPWVSLSEMRAVARAGAMLLLTCRGYDERGCFEVHGYPEDFYRYSTGGIAALLNHTGWEPVETLSDPQAPGVLAVGRAR